MPQVNVFPPFFFAKDHLLKVLSFAFGGVYVHVDQRVEGVKIPKEHEDRDFFVDLEQGNVQADPSFGLRIVVFRDPEKNSEPVTCEIPWQAIYCFRYLDEFLVIWVKETPEQVRKIFIEQKILPAPDESNPDRYPGLCMSPRIEWAMRYSYASMSSFLERQALLDQPQDLSRVFEAHLQRPDVPDPKEGFVVFSGGAEQKVKAEKPPSTEHLRVVNTTESDDESEAAVCEEKDQDWTNRFGE
jgi:hypothetical protein